jgi:hypothetical protein
MQKLGALLCITTALGTGCASNNTRPPFVAPHQTTIAALMLEPQAHDGEIVKIRGPAVGMFEVSFICDTLEEIEDTNSACLWIVPGEFSYSDYHQKVIELVGRFDSHAKGHMGAYAGSVEAVSISVLGQHSLGEPPPHEPSR